MSLEIRLVGSKFGLGCSLTVTTGWLLKSLSFHFLIFEMTMTPYNANALKRVNRKSAYLEGLLWGSSDKSPVCCMCGKGCYFSLFQKKGGGGVAMPALLTETEPVNRPWCSCSNVLQEAAQMSA